MQKIKSDESEDQKNPEQTCPLTELPAELLKHLGDFLTEKKDILNFSSTCRRSFDSMRRRRVFLVVPKLCEQANLTHTNLASPNPQSVDDTRLRSSAPLYGYALVITLEMLVQNFAAMPLMKAPVFIQSVRDIKAHWEKLNKQYSGALGFILLFSSKFPWYQERFSWPEMLTGSLEMLRYLYAMKYLIENRMEEQQALQDTLFDTGKLELAGLVMLTIQQRRIHFHLENFNRLVEAICNVLPLGHKDLAQYYNMQGLKFHMQREAFEELQKEGLVEEDAKNPVQSYSSWNL